MSKKLKVILTISGVTVVTGGVGAGAAIMLPKLIKKHADLGMSKAEVLKKLGDPDHTSESGDYWYYFEKKIGKKYKEKDELEHTWNEANQIKAQSIGLELEAEHFESRTIHFSSENTVISYFFNTDTKYKYENESFTSWTEKNSVEVTTNLPSEIKCFVNSLTEDGIYHYLIADEGFQKSFNYEAKFEDKSLIKYANATSFDISGPKQNIKLEWEYDDIKLSIKPNFEVYDSMIVATTDAKNIKIVGDGLYNIGDTVNLKAENTQGYLINGWDTDVSYSFGTRTATHLTDESNYSFVVEEFGKKEFEFLAELEVYTITYILDGGINSSNNPTTFTIEDSISFANPHKENAVFQGWYDQFGNQVTEIKEGTHGNLVLEAYFINYGTIIYELNGGINNENNPVYYSPLEETVLYSPTKQGYEFEGWYDESGNIRTSIPVGTIGEITLSAHWTPKLNELSVTSEDGNKGIVSITSGNGYSGELITVVATPVGGCIFKGWYNESTKLCGDESYTFIMPTNNFSLVACFFSKEETDELCRLGGIPTLSDDEKVFYYGLYPQTNVNDASLISSLNTLSTPELNGWYLYDGDYYAKLNATPYKTGYKFDNGLTILSDTVYWFKCEPIIWNVLSNNNNEYFAVSSLLLDAHCFYNCEDLYETRIIDGQTIYANNYKYSDIRAWLNGDFYNRAFALGDKYVQTTVVDNSLPTADDTRQHYICPNTEDKVFLLSYADYNNSSYGFSSDMSRYCRTTDWARAKGALIDGRSGMYEPYMFNGNYLTRSPGMNSYYLSCVSAIGKVPGGGLVNNGYHSVRPGITIKLS